MKTILTTTIAIGCIAVGGQAFAAENWTTRLPGVTEGLPSGALPPAGVYFVNETLFTPTHLYSPGSTNTSVRLDAFVDVPIVEWVPGIKLLGADYAVALAQPFDNIVTTGGSTISNGSNLGSGFGWYDTLAVPGILSWTLPHDFHVAAQLGVWLPDGSKDIRMAVKNSNRYWAVEPGLGVSWLHDGWAANLLLTYDFNFEHSADNPALKDYRSGDQFIAEYSVTNTIGKWTFGIGGYGLKQVEQDELTAPNGVKTKAANSEAEKYAIGPIVGYNFGPVIVQAYYHENLETKNYVGGNEFWTRVLIPF
jgi:hypothetical protein